MPFTKRKADTICDISRAIVFRWSAMINRLPSSPEDFSYIARELHCQVRFAACSASYSPIEGQDGVDGLLAVDPSLERATLMRMFAHELSHHVLFWWVDLRWGWDWTEDVAEMGATSEFEEAICDAVSNLIAPLPDCVQDNGKLGLPNLPGIVARCGWHNPIPTCMAMPSAEIERHDAHLQFEQEIDNLSLFLNEESNLNLID